jgi:hypothetical protein
LFGKREILLLTLKNALGEDSILQETQVLSRILLRQLRQLFLETSSATATHGTEDINMSIKALSIAWKLPQV